MISKVAALNPSAAAASAESMKQAIEEEIETLNIDPNSAEGKMKKKQIRNRLSAQLHRDNKKQYITDLELEVTQYKEQADSLKSLLRQYIDENEILRSQLINENTEFILPDALVCPNGTFENVITAAVPPSKINFDALDAMESTDPSSPPAKTATDKAPAKSKAKAKAAAPVPAAVPAPMEVSPVNSFAPAPLLPHVIPSLQEYYSSLYKKPTAVSAPPTHATHGQWGASDTHSSSGSESDYSTTSSGRTTHGVIIGTVSNGSSSGHSSDEYESADETGLSNVPTPPGPVDGLYLSNLFRQVREGHPVRSSINTQFPAAASGSAPARTKKSAMALYSLMFLFGFSFFVGTPLSSLFGDSEGVVSDSNWQSLLDMFSSHAVNELHSDLEVDFNQDVMDILMESDSEHSVKTETADAMPYVSSGVDHGRVLLSTNSLPGLYSTANRDTSSNPNESWSDGSGVAPGSYEHKWAKYANQLISTAAGSKQNSNAVAVLHNSRYSDLMAKLEQAAPHSNDDLYRTYLEMLDLLSRYKSFDSGENEGDADADIVADLLAKQLWIYTDNHAALPLFTADPAASMCPPRILEDPHSGSKTVNASVPRPPVHRFLRGVEPRRKENEPTPDKGLVPFVSMPSSSSAAGSARSGESRDESPSLDSLSRGELIGMYTKQIEQLTALVRSLSSQQQNSHSGGVSVAPILLSDGREHAADKPRLKVSRSDGESADAERDDGAGSEEQDGSLPPVLSRILVSNGKALLHPSLMNSRWSEQSTEAPGDRTMVSTHAQPQLLTLLVPASTIRWGNVWSPSYPSVPADSKSMWAEHNASDQHGSEPMDTDAGVDADDKDSAGLNDVWVEINCNILNTQLLRDVATI